MRGDKQLSEKLFYSFSLDDAVPKEHVLRRLASVLDLGFVKQRTRDLYYHAGHQSVDPVVVVKVLLLDFLHNIGSIRETMRQASDRLSFRWFLGYDIDEPLPTHSAISKNLARFGPDLFQDLFDETVQLCVKHRLVGGKLVHVDSTTLKANASEDSVRLKLDEDAFHPDLAPPEYWQQVKKEMAKAQPNVNDRLESTTDPDADILSRDGKGRKLAYKDHRAVDDMHGVILATQATGAAVTDQAQFQEVVDEVLWRQRVIAEGIAADRIYGTIDNYTYLLSKEIEPTIPRKAAARRKGKFGKERFRYDRLADRYICPAGQELRPQGKTGNNAELYRASGPSCAACPLRDQCVSGKKHPRTIQRNRDDAIVDRALKDKGRAAFRHRMTRRMTVVEGSFGEAKERHGHHRTRWRGCWKVQVQCWLVASIQNLKKLLKWAWNDAAPVAGRIVLAKSGLSMPLLRTFWWRHTGIGNPLLTLES